MLKKTITYEDYDGNTITEDFYFNLTKAELIKMELSEQGGLSEAYERIINARDVPEMIRIFDQLIEKAYGVKSPDGKRFIKNEEVYEAFKENPAYDVIFSEIITDTEKSLEFFNGIIPNVDGMIEKLEELNKQQGIEN